MVPFNGKPINLNRKIPRATSGGNRFDFATWSLRFTEANQSFLDATQVHKIRRYSKKNLDVTQIHKIQSYSNLRIQANNAEY